MTSDEFNEWERFMKESRGLWTVDPIHNGVNRDLLVFRCRPTDHTSGVYVSIIGPEIRAGHFYEAVPSIGDAIFITQWSACFPDRIGQKYPPLKGTEKPTGWAMTAISILGI